MNQLNKTKETESFQQDTLMMAKSYKILQDLSIFVKKEQNINQN